MKQGPDQIALPLDWPQSEGDARFIVSAANEDAFEHFRKFSLWPVKATILSGPRRSGRTLLARSFIERVGGRLFDEADQRDEEELFHAWNQAQDTGRPLVMVADQVPPAWSPRLPDLKTRLAITPFVRIHHPDDVLFPALVQLHFADHDVLTPGDAPDVLVAMNPAALKANLVDLPRGADIIANTDEFSKRNLSRVGYGESPLEDGSLAAYNVHAVPITSMTVKALEEFEITRKDAERANGLLGQCFRVRSGDLPPAVVPACNVRQPDAKNRGLQLVEAAVHAPGNVDVAVGLAVLPDEADPLRKVVVVRDDRAAVAERSDVLRGIEAEASHPPDRAGTTATELGAVGLRAVFDDLDVCFACHRRDRVKVGALAVEVDGNNCACLLADRTAQRLGVHRSSIGLDVAEDRPRTRALDRRHRRNAGVGLGHDLVPGPDLERA